MDQLVSFLSGMTYWHWMALGSVLLIVEIVTPTFYFLWFGIAAVLVGLLKLMMPDLTWQACITIFGALSIISTVVWHMVYKKGGTDGGEPDLNQRARRYLGRRAIAQDHFRNGRGAILLDDTRWQAVAEGHADIGPGASVEITGVDGATLKVRPI
jgi:membrane protein implicated in regulation of membrane protease activity